MMYELLFPKSLSYEVMRKDKLRITYSDKNARQTSEPFERLIAQRKAFLRLQSSAHPGRKFRLRVALQLSDGSYRLDLGPTDYFEYLITNHDPKLNALLINSGVRDHKDPDAYLSNAIGNLGIVTTVDNQIAVLRRSDDVATFPGYFDLPGGHPEPDRVYSRLAQGISLSSELYGAILREVEEELNLGRWHVDDLRLIGIIRSLEDGRKPDMIFHLPTRLTAEQLGNFYTSVATTRNESCQLLVANAFKLRRMALPMTAPSIAALDLYTSR